MRLQFKRGGFHYTILPYQDQFPHGEIHSTEVDWVKFSMVYLCECLKKDNQYYEGYMDTKFYDTDFTINFHYQMIPIMPK